jgi:hypothetical protein
VLKAGTVVPCTAAPVDLLGDAAEPPPPAIAVPVGTVVTVPVPAVPAWLMSALHSLATDPDWIPAFPPKSQAVEALLWIW